MNTPKTAFIAIVGKANVGKSSILNKLLGTKIAIVSSKPQTTRTRIMGVNTLAFRLAQNETFYMSDADCVGILKDYIPWEKNKQWLHVLSYSNTPLFISCNDSISDEIKKDLAEAFKVFNEPHEFRPVDIFETKIPTTWEIDGKEYKYNWD